MVGFKLHSFQLQLLDYLQANFRDHLDDGRFRQALRAELGEPLFAYLATEGGEEVEPDEQLVPSAAELIELEEATQALRWMRKGWRPYHELHERKDYCIAEVRDLLTRQSAEEWASASSQFAATLEQDVLCLHEGVAVMVKWVGLVRRLLKASGAVYFLPSPDGLLPTPTHPAPPAGPRSSPTPAGRQSTDLAEAVIERMRQAIRETPEGKEAKPATLIRAAKIATKSGRKALRWLEQHEGYQGFHRPRPSKPSRPQPRRR